MEEFNPWNRRRFLGAVGTAALAAGIGGIPATAFARGNVSKLTILHTNDTHSRIDPFPEDDPKWPGLGGVARRMYLINQIRATEPNVLLLDSGDIFQGTPYFNLYGGEVELKLMSKMGYDATTLGNHDFDNGIDGLVKQLPHANFPYLNANYRFDGTALQGIIQPYKLFNKGGIRIGVFGIGIELAGLVDDKLYGKTVYTDPIEAANKTAKFLSTTEKCDLVICLSHLGYKYDNPQKVSDVVLAQQSEHIDLILGGHTHTFLDQPVEYSNAVNKKINISQVGWAGIRLGRIDFFFERKSSEKSLTGTTVKISTKSS